MHALFFLYTNVCYKKEQDKSPLDKSPLTNSPHNEIIIQSYYNFYIDGDIKYILKIKTNPNWKRRGGEINTKYKIL